VESLGPGCIVARIDEWNRQSNSHNRLIISSLFLKGRRMDYFIQINVFSAEHLTDTIVLLLIQQNRGFAELLTETV
jgi:hypothetical protein